MVSPPQPLLAASILLRGLLSSAAATSKTGMLLELQEFGIFSTFEVLLPQPL